MNVILLQDVEKLGVMGDKVAVKDGFARNYLIPGKLAIEATSGALAVIERKKKEKAREEGRKKAAAVMLSEKINGLSCTIASGVGAEDKLFGSVTPDMIAEALSAEGIEIDKKKIELAEPIKTPGVYNVDIKLHPEVRARLRLWIVKK